MDGGHGPCRRAPREMTGADAAAPASHVTRPSVDISLVDSTAPSAIHDFKRSPLGRSVVTALEAQLDRVS